MFFICLFKEAELNCVSTNILSIPPGAGYKPPELPPAQRKAAIIAALGDWVSGISDQRALLLVVEDAHWMDATTQELMTRLIHALGGASVLIVITARPNFSSPWSRRAQVSIVGLERLNNQQCEDFVARVAWISANTDLSVEAVRRLAEADGNRTHRTLLAYRWF